MSLSTTYTKVETDFLIQQLEEKASDKYNDESNSIANDIIKFIDINTGENVNYRETTTWYDGTAMNDSKVDDVIYIKKNNKYYKRQLEGFVNVKWAGCGNGQDDTQVINSLIQNFDILYFPKGDYLIKNAGLNLRSNVEIFGDGVHSRLITDDSTIWGVSINSGNKGTSNVEENTKNIKIHDLHFFSSFQQFNEHTHLLNINAATNVQIDRCFFTGFRGDGIYIGSSNTAGTERHNKDIYIRNCVFDGINNENRNGISIIDGTNIYIEKNIFKNCTKSNMPGGVDIEPDTFSFHVIKNIHVKDNYFENVGGNDGVVALVSNSNLTELSKDIFISGNMFKNCKNANSIYIRSGNSYKDANILIEKNYVENCVGSGMLIFSSGCVVRNNHFNGTNREFYLSYIDNPSINNVLFYENYFENFALENSSGGIVIFNAKNITFKNNRFHNATKRVNGQDYIFYLHKGTTENIVFKNNSFTKDSGTNGYLVVLNPNAVTNENTNIWENNYSDVIRPNYFKYLRNKGTTAERNTAPPIGHNYYDTDLKKSIYWNGTNWTDANGNNI